MQCLHIIYRSEICIGTVSQKRPHFGHLGNCCTYDQDIFATFHATKNVKVFHCVQTVVPQEPDTQVLKLGLVGYMVSVAPSMQVFTPQGEAKLNPACFVSCPDLL